jgi:hypothetical protein
MSKAQKRGRVLLLPDDPSDADEFAAKAHETLADAIADLVVNEPGGRVIGLEGSWGSGKSTVVRLLTNRLHGNRSSATLAPESRAVIFDAWAHQGDPLRRSFLETVIEDLESVGWLSAQNANSFRSKLSGKTSTVHTKTTSRLSLEGKIASAAAVLLPLGAVLAANRFSHHHRVFLALGALILVGPLLVVLVFVLAKAAGVALQNVKPGGWRERLSTLRPFGFFANEQDTDTTTTGIERGDPTSVEFEQLFSNALDASLTDSRRLLLVLDNIDRVEASDAKKVLATMQTFTSTASPKRSWSECVWTLIPYDPTGLDRLWDTSSVDTEESAGDPKSLTSPTSAAFIDKVFQIRFETPPLVLSDWRAYLVRLLKEGMPGECDFAPVTRLRALYPGAEPRGLVATEEATPRHLKQFVNQIGGGRRLRSDISLVHLAYYALLRHDRVDVARGLIDGSLPHPGLKHLLGASIDEDLAAIHFGTTQALAQQLLLGGALEQALAAGDSDEVSKLKDRSGFADALDSLDVGSRAGDGGIELTRAVAVLDAGGGLQTTGDQGWWSAVVLPLARDNNSWSLSGRESGVGLAILFHSVASNDSDLFELLTKVDPGAHEADTDGHLQLEGLAGLADALIERGRYAQSLRVQVEIPADRLPESLAFFGSQSSDDRSRAMFEIGLTPTEVAGAFVRAATTESSAEVGQALSVVLSRPERIDLAALEGGCLEWLRAQDPGNAAQFDVLLGILDLVRLSRAPEDVPTGSLGAAADDGTLMHLVSVASRNAWYEPAATASMLCLRVRPDLPVPQAIREATQGTEIVGQSLRDPSVNPELVAGQLAWLQKHSREAFDLLSQVAADATFKPWVDHQLGELSASSELVVSADQYLQRWSQLRDVLQGDRFAELTRSLLRKARTRKTILARSSDPALALVVLEATTAIGDDGSSDCRTWASGIIKGTAATAWQAALENPGGDPILGVAVALAGYAEAPTDPLGLSDALHSHFQTLAAGAPAWQPDSATFAKLTSLLGAPARRVLASQLCAELEGRDGRVGPSLFTTYGTFLANEAAFRSHAKLPNFIERAVANDEWGSVEWIVEVARKYPDTLLPKNRKKEMEHLRNRVAGRISELSEAGSNPPDALGALSKLLQ